MSLKCLFVNTSATRLTRGSTHGDVRNHLHTYLDETGKTRLQVQGFGKSRGVWPNLDTPVVSGANVSERHDRVIMPADYLRGQLTVGGFLRELMVLKGYPRQTGHDAFEKHRWIDAVAIEWTKLLSKHRSSSQKGLLVRDNFSLSLSGDLTRRLSLANVSALVFLERVLERTFARYLKQHGYDADDNLGYVYGFHMDTSNLHIQLSMFPRTRKGKMVKVSEMSRSSDRTFQFRNNMTRYACDAASELEHELLGRSNFGEVPAKEFTMGLLRSRRAYSEYGEMVAHAGRNGLYQEVEERLARGFGRSVGLADGALEPLMPSFRRFIRRYAGGTAEQAKSGVDYQSDDGGGLLRRMSRLWLRLKYEEIEREELRKAEAAKSIEGSAASDFPMDLLPVRQEFVRRVLRGADKPEALAENVRKHSLRKREAVALDIQKELPSDVEFWREEFLELKDLFDQFVLYLDERLLFGTGVFYSQMGLMELELAAQSQGDRAWFKTRKVSGLAPQKGMQPEAVKSGEASDNRITHEVVEPPEDKEKEIIPGGF